ncbi:MAG: DUF1588 domain-containing protein, partial [Planctomycetales bacterium]
DSTTTAAVEFAEIAAAELWPRFRNRRRDLSDDNRARLRGFLTETVETAFRSSLDDETRKLYVDRQVDASEDDAEAIKRSLLISLKSPRFLYPLMDRGESVSQRAANRLSLTLHDSLPADAWLIKLARENRLDTEPRIRAAAQRMTRDYRTQAKTRAMLHAWLNLSHIGEITKNAERFPDFDAELASDLKASLDAFLDEVVWSEASDFRELLQADWAPTNERLHAFYGPAWKPADKGQGLRKSVAASEQRMGLISHPYLMSGLAYPDSTSPIHRGVFVVRSLLGRFLKPPPIAVAPLDEGVDPTLTTRQRVMMQTSEPTCQTCHSMINPLGFSFENYDAVGRFRDKEKAQPIDAS